MWLQENEAGRDRHHEEPLHAMATSQNTCLPHQTLGGPPQPRPDPWSGSLDAVALSRGIPTQRTEEAKRLSQQATHHHMRGTKSNWRVFQKTWDTPRSRETQEGPTIDL